MTDDQHTYLSYYRFPLEIEQVEDGSFMATSPALEDLLVQADTIEEVMASTPGVTKALLGAMREMGVPVALEAEELHFPVKIDVLVG